MTLILVGPYFTIVPNPERIDRLNSCGRCIHGLLYTIYLLNPRDYIWCNVENNKVRRNTSGCSTYKDIWKRL